MSLRHQINLRILLSLMWIVLLGSAITIWQARNSVSKEVDSSINLAVHLISFAMMHSSTSGYTPVDWLSQLNALQETRHLSIQLQMPSGQIAHFATHVSSIHDQKRPPQWFIHLVTGNYPMVKRQLMTADGQQLTLIIKANPLDEMTEAWQESLAFFALVLLLALFVFLTVHLVFKRTLKSIVTIVDALKNIEAENYQHKVPEFSIQEYNQIAKAINHLTDQLHTSQQENRALTQHSLAIQEEERKKLSQELHDELGQSLTAIKVMAVAGSHLKADIKKITQTIADVCDHLIRVVRSMMRQLHPLILTELGLKAALEDLLQHWSLREPSLQVLLQCSPNIDQLEQNIAIQVFRVVQECLTNVVRHAKATQATVRLSFDEVTGVLCLQIKDNGLGCADIKMNHGFGLLSMKERINSLGGDLVISSAPQQGMQITARICLS